MTTCGDCKHLALTEKEQDEFYNEHGYYLNHECSKYRVKLVHGDKHPEILKSTLCLDRREDPGVKSYIIVFEDGGLGVTDKFSGDLVALCDDGLGDVIDISTNPPTQYYEGEWHEIKKH